MNVYRNGGEKQWYKDSKTQTQLPYWAVVFSVVDSNGLEGACKTMLQVECKNKHRNDI